MRLPQCERTPTNGLKSGNARCVWRHWEVGDDSHLTQMPGSGLRMKCTDLSGKTRILKTNRAEIDTDARSILKTQMEMCPIVTIRSLWFGYFSFTTILNTESRSEAHTLTHMTCNTSAQLATRPVRSFLWRHYWLLSWKMHRYEKEITRGKRDWTQVFPIHLFAMSTNGK